MRLTLERFAYTPTETQGRLTADGFECATLEQPWRPGRYPGGESFRSCIPDGEYCLFPFERPNGERVFALVNESLGVHLYGKRGDPFRFLCLIHPANFVYEIAGCIAPGRDRVPTEGLIMVTHSRATMADLLARVPWDYHDLTIKRTAGAVDRWEQ